MANYGFEIYDGTISSCVFIAGLDECGNATSLEAQAIEASGTFALIEGNKFESSSVNLSWQDNCVFTSNSLYRSSLTIDECFAVTVTGNQFEGNATLDSTLLLYSVNSGISIGGNTFSYYSPVVFAWGSTNSEISITGNTFFGNDGIRMDTSWSYGTFTLAGFTISDNEMLDLGTTPANQRIELGRSGAAVSDGTITGNVISNSGDVSALIYIENDGSLGTVGDIVISNNVLKGHGTSRPYAVKIVETGGFD